MARSHRELRYFHFCIPPIKMSWQKNYFSFKIKGTEEDERTTELYSKQGNTDITELVGIDEMTQSEICKEHNAKERSCCKVRVKPSRATVLVKRSTVTYFVFKVFSLRTCFFQLQILSVDYVNG